MNAGQRLRVRELFERALDLQPADMTAWVAREAADDAAVAAEVGSLLAHHEQAGAFLSSPVTERVAHLLDDDPRFDPGAVVGSYTIVREIGRGGMGRVYLATDSRLGRTVALKALPPALTRDAAQRERLRREARAAASLTHPGICTIYALEEFDGDVFIVAEFVDGHSLREEIARGVRPSGGAVLETARQLADALTSAHAKGITHRDLKPENVMRGRDGRLKILDFGLALVDVTSTGSSPLARVTQPGTIVGTPAYMAPEQLTGDPADARSDVFALGVLLYEYASGVHPFDAQTPLALAARVLEGEPRALHEVRPDLAPEVVSVVSRCLRKAPGERFASAADIVRALDRHEPPAVPSVVTWWRAHQMVAIGMYVLAAGFAWQIKEWQRGSTTQLFLVIGVGGTIAAVFRGHLLFAERMNRASFHAERRRAEPITLGVDIFVALALVLGALTISSGHSVVALLAIALGVGIALARLVVERATVHGAFGAVGDGDGHVESRRGRLSP